MNEIHDNQHMPNSQLSCGLSVIIVEHPQTTSRMNMFYPLVEKNFFPNQQHVTYISYGDTKQSVFACAMPDCSDDNVHYFNYGSLRSQ